MITIPVSARTTPVWSGKELAQKQIAITFDDGPSDPHTATILDVLKEEGWPAHFFHQGRWAERSPELSKRAATEGHAVGSHSWSHPHLPELSLTEATLEIARGVEAVTQAASVYTPFFRFPFGAKNAALEDHVRAQGLVSFFWNIDARDWEIKDPSALLENILTQVRQQTKGIILLHDTIDVTAAILPALIKELKTSGFVPVKFVNDFSAADVLVGTEKDQLRSSRTERPILSAAGSSVALPSPAPPLTGKFRCSLDLVRLPAGENNVFVYCRSTQGMAVLPASKVRLLNRCKIFKTLDEHTRLISAELKFSALHFNHLRRNLEEFANAGLLDSQPALISQCKRESLPDRPPPISAVAIPTFNRADRLKVGVESYARCSNDYRQPVSFYIADQSDTEESAQATLDVLTAAKAEFGCQIYYAGAREKEELARTLASHTGHPFDMVNFAVSNDENCPKAYGANRNALLLGTIGSLILQTDDDGQCQLRSSPQWKAGLTLTSKYFPLQTYFPAASEVEPLERGFENADMFSVHQQLLGKTLEQCSQPHSHIDLDGTISSFFSRQAPSTVAVTMLGIAGGSGIGTSFWHLQEADKARVSLLDSEEQYRHAMSKQQLIRFATNPTISDGAYCGGLNLGMDNRQLLPPFMPVMRNEDGIFGHVMRMASCGYFGFLPWVTHHAGPSTSSAAEDLRHFASHVPFGHLLEAVLRDFEPRPKHGDSAKNLVAIGKYLIDFASGPLPDFEARLRLVLLGRASKLITNLQSCLDQYNRQPDYWAADVEMCIAAIEEAAASKEYIVASDLCPFLAEEVARQLQQRLIRRFGELLTIWMDLRVAAAQLQDRGWQPFRQL